MNELFGSYTFDASGKIIQFNQGKVISVNENQLILCVQKKEKVLNMVFKNY